MDEIKIVRDESGQKVVVIPEIIFKNKQDIDWDAVEDYLKRYVGEIIQIEETKEEIKIENRFADEYTGSKYSEHIKGARAKAKANAVQGIKELVKIANGKIHSENRKSKHKKDAKGGWSYYTTKFAIPIYNNGIKTKDYNIYKGRLVVNKASDGNLYLYDLVDIKKEASTPLRIRE